MKNRAPIVKDLVLAGGGHSHVSVLKRFGMKPLPGVRITLICRDAHTPYSGMLPGLIAGHYEFDETHIDLRRLSRFAGARFYHDEIVGLDPEKQEVICANRPPVPYDLLSINVGSTPAVTQVPGTEHNVVPVKPIDQFYAHWQSLRVRLLERSQTTRIGVVGGGAGGIELILALQYRLRRDLETRGRRADDLEFHLFTDQDALLHTHNLRAAAKFERVLRERAITVHLRHEVTRVDPGALHFADGGSFRLEEILWVTWAGPAPWIRASGLAVDSKGFLSIDDFLRSISHPTVFGAGDCATMVNHPRPKSGVFAVRQGPYLYGNLRSTLVGKPSRRYVPQRKFLGLISTGDRYAVASRGGWALEGAYLWTLKDWIDRRFMHRFEDLPDMEAEETSTLDPGLLNHTEVDYLGALTMRCGGCGAKVGAPIVNRVLSTVTPVRRDEVLVGLDAPDDAAVIEVPSGKLMVHTVDMFRAFIDDPYLFARVAVNHALSDIYAMGAEPHSALVIATLPYGPERKITDQLSQLMSGVSQSLAAANTALVGGHTSEGSELSLGFSVNGLVEPQRMLRKAGMQDGDCLILTKALGTGILFAADMRHRARGRWIDTALQSMLQCSAPAAECLREHGATACTDVTGFGLAGHLLEMARASTVGVEIELRSLPLLDGSLELAGAGIFSSLQPQNRRLEHEIESREQVARAPMFSLLFDPQTAGGLLASVPATKAQTCVQALSKLGYQHAAIVGRVLARKTDQPTIRVY